MKDPVFAGQDVAEAVRAAAEALGLGADRLRYVVLQEGTPGARGISPTPARIAVLLEAMRGPGLGGAAPRPEPPAEEEDDTAGGNLDTAGELRAVVRALARAADVELEATIEETADALVVRIAGPGTDLLLEDDAEAFRALDALVQRGWRPRVEPRRLVLECAGFRERRDDALAARARRVADEVRRDGQPRTLDDLNAYERRIVHMALGEDPEIETYSVGEGPARRITIARRSGSGAPAAPEPSKDSPPRED